MIDQDELRRELVKSTEWMRRPLLWSLALQREAGPLRWLRRLPLKAVSLVFGLQFRWIKLALSIK